MVKHHAVMLAAAVVHSALAVHRSESAKIADMAATVSPRALAVVKAQVHRHLATSFDVAATESEALMATALVHPDAAEGANSFIERRPPRFAPWTGDQP